MRIAVLSDIHSNFSAFKACVADCIREKADAFIFLGDYITDCAYPQDTMGLLYELKENYDCRFIIGNRDEYMLAHARHEGSEWYPCSGCGALYYTYHHLAQKDLAFFDSLNFYEKARFGTMPELLLCHGSPKDVKEPIRAVNAAGWLEKLEGDSLLCGHTHRQGIFTQNHRFIFNAGSVGFQLDGNPMAKMGYLVSDGSRWQPIEVQIDYDRDGELKRLKESGLYESAPVWSHCTEWAILTGEDRTLKCLARVSELAQPGEAWPYPEKYWRQAQRELL